MASINHSTIPTTLISQLIALEMFFNAMCCEPTPAKASNKLIFVFLIGGFSEEFAGLNFILIYILSFIGQKRANDEDKLN
jgi:RsiW-degrading membrane proteinase PrsW (M82 family)